MLSERRVFWAACVAAVLAATTDQLTKLAVTTHFGSGALARSESLPLIEDVLYIVSWRNTGAAFSILRGNALFLTVFTSLLLAAVLVAFVLRRKKENGVMLTGLALLLGGGGGNLADRIRLGYVVDFIDLRLLRVPSFIPRFIEGFGARGGSPPAAGAVSWLDTEPFPIFNMADVFVCAACILILSGFILDERKTARARRGAEDFADVSRR